MRTVLVFVPVVDEVPMIDWTHWHNEPLLVGGLIFIGWLHALFTGPLRPAFAPDAPLSFGCRCRFYGALAIFYFAVGSPLDQIGERFLLSAHMVQHQLLIYVAAPLFLSGLPPWLIDGVMARSCRLRALAACFTHPVVCGLAYVLTLSIWHAPAFYEAALENKRIHILEHIMFFGAALLYWWPVLSPSRVLPPPGHGLKIAYLLGVTIGMTPLFAFIAFSDNVLYPVYEYAPRLFAALTPREDQLLGAGIMKLGDMAVTIGVCGMAFYRWYLESEKKQAEEYQGALPK